MRVRLHRRATHPVHPFMITATVTATVALLLTALIFGGTFPAATAFAHSYEYGVRAYGMGGAFTAVADDVTALIYNPAGLSRNSFDLSLGVGSANPAQAANLLKFIQDPNHFEPKEFKLDINTVSGVSIGRFGAGFAGEGAAEGFLLCPGGFHFCANGGFMTRILVGAALRPPFIETPEGMEFGLSLQRLMGARVAYQRREIPTGYYAEHEQWNGQGYGLGLGMQWRLQPSLTLGLHVNDLLSSVTWNGSKSSGNYLIDGTPDGPIHRAPLDETVEAGKPVFRAGVAIVPPLLATTLAADISSDGVISLGVESRALRAVTLRAGQLIAANERKTTLGIGANWGPVSFDVSAGTSDFKDFGFNVAGSVRF